MKLFYKKIFFISLFLLVVSFNFALAESNIDSEEKYAWGENIGWINFNTDNGEVVVSDSTITGYAWNENYGWINLAPDNSGITNDGQGNLSGYAWGENIGWVDFSNASINENGYFTGYAESTISGQINFDCDNCSVKTNWTITEEMPDEDENEDEEEDEDEPELDSPEEDDGEEEAEDTEEEPTYFCQEDITKNNITKITGKKTGKGIVKIYGEDDEIIGKFEAFSKGGAYANLIKLQNNYYISVIKRRSGTTMHIYDLSCNVVSKKKLSTSLHPRKIAIKQLLNKSNSQEIAVSSHRGTGIHVKIFRYNPTKDIWKKLKYKFLPKVKRKKYSISATKNKSIFVENLKNKKLYKWQVRKNKVTNYQN